MHFGLMLQRAFIDYGISSSKPEYFACNNHLLYFVRGPELPGLSVPGRIGSSYFKLETDIRDYREAHSSVKEIF